MVRESVVLVAALVLLAGCASMGSGNGDAGDPQEQAASGGADAGGPGGDGGGGGNDAASGADAPGESLSGGDGDQGAAANVNRALTKTGTVRVENLRAQRDRLRSLYESANTTEDLLRVQEQLSSVQGEIERLEAKKRSLEDQVAFSTLRVELREPRPEGERTPQPAFHEQSPVGAFLNSAQGFFTFGQTVLIAGVAAVPWVLGLGVPALLLVRVGRRISPWSGPPLLGRRSKSDRDSRQVDDDGNPLEQAFDGDDGEAEGVDEGQDDRTGEEA